MKRKNKYTKKWPHRPARAQTVTILWGEEYLKQWSFFIPKKHKRNSMRDTIRLWKAQIFGRGVPMPDYRRVVTTHEMPLLLD